MASSKNKMQSPPTTPATGPAPKEPPSTLGSTPGGGDTPWMSQGGNTLRSIPQKMGRPLFNRDSVPAGGRLPFPDADPKTDRDGLVAPNGRRPFKLKDAPPSPVVSMEDAANVGDPGMMGSTPTPDTE